MNSPITFTAAKQTLGISIDDMSRKLWDHANQHWESVLVPWVEENEGVKPLRELFQEHGHWLIPPPREGRTWKHVIKSIQSQPRAEARTTNA